MPDESYPNCSRDKMHLDRRSNRRAEARRRLRQVKLKRAIRASGVPCASRSLAKLAKETIQLIEHRIQYWMDAGDELHVKRLKAVRQKLLNTYRK